MSEFKDKYHLTPQQSLFLAKKKWDENVYCGMKMENRAVTFPQTQTILNGVNIRNRLRTACSSKRENFYRTGSAFIR